MKTLKWHTVN